MKKCFIVIFLLNNCLAISVSQLEQLQKARKEVASELHQYNTIAQMDTAHITAWKKKIENNLNTIKKFDQSDAQRLQNTMIEPTFQAIDRISKQRSAPVLGTSTTKPKQEKERDIARQAAQVQAPDDAAFVQLQVFNAAKAEIERLITLYRQSDDWHNVFEDALKRVDKETADRYRSQVPKKSVESQKKPIEPIEPAPPLNQQKSIKQVQEQHVTVPPINQDAHLISQAVPKKNVVPPASKKQKDQSVQNSQEKTIIDPEGSKVGHEIEKAVPVNEIVSNPVIITPVVPLPAESPKQPQEQHVTVPPINQDAHLISQAVPKKNVVPPASKKQKDQSVQNSQVKTIIDPEGSKAGHEIEEIVPANEIVSNPIIITPVVPLTSEPAIQQPEPLKEGGSEGVITKEVQSSALAPEPTEQKKEKVPSKEQTSKKRPKKSTQPREKTASTRPTVVTINKGKTTIPKKTNEPHTLVITPADEEPKKIQSDVQTKKTAPTVNNPVSNKYEKKFRPKLPRDDPSLTINAV